MDFMIVNKLFIIHVSLGSIFLRVFNQHVHLNSNKLTN